MNKHDILLNVIAEIKEKLEQAQAAATQAHLAAIDDQSVAETQYDTLAIEAAYLAEGQSRRIEEFKQQIHQLTAFSIQPKSQAELGALVALQYDNGDNDSERDSNIEQYYLILPCGAGIKIVDNYHEVLIITPASPLAKSLQGKLVDDEFLLTNSTTNITGIISAIY
ncbi:hypothetical protein [Colwellia sp. MEBiC06753]